MNRPENLIHDFAAAWNEHDLGALGELFVEGATFVNRFGHLVRGVDEIVELHRPLHEMIYSDSTLENELIEMTDIADGVCVIHCWSRLTAGAAHPAGAHAVDTVMQIVAVRRDERWQIQALENVTLTNPRTGETMLRK